MKRSDVPIEKFDMVWLALKEALKQTGMKSAVLVVQDANGYSATFGWPGCGPECDSPRICMAENLESVASHLERRAEDLRDGSVVETPKPKTKIENIH